MADRILNRVPVDKLEEIRDLLTERRHGNPARSPAHNARLLVDELIAVAPPPRLVPDRPSDAAIAQAFWEVTGEYRPNVPSSVIAHGVITRAKAIDAAAPPAEAPGDVIESENVKVEAGFVYENGTHMPTVLVSFKPNDWAARDKFVADVKAAAPAAPASVSRGERIRQLNYEIWMDSDGMSGVEPPDDWKANYLTTAPRVTGGREDSIVRIARYLSNRAADACGIDREDNWKVYGDEYRDDAIGVLAALQAATGGGDA